MTTTLMLNDSETLVVRGGSTDRFEVDATYAPGGSRAPKHTHPHHDESFTVLSGTLRVAIGTGAQATERDYVAGEAFGVPRGAVHHMWNPGTEPATVRWTSTPAGRVEEFFTAMDRVHREGPAGRLGQAGVLHRYSDVMRPASPLLRAAVCLLAPVARLVGSR